MEYDWKAQHMTITLDDDDEYSWADYIRDTEKRFKEGMDKLSEELKKELFTEGTKTR